MGLTKTHKRECVLCPGVFPGQSDFFLRNSEFVAEDSAFVIFVVNLLIFQVFVEVFVFFYAC